MKVGKVILFEGPDGPVTIRPNPKAQLVGETDAQFLARVWAGQPHPKDAVPVVVDVVGLPDQPDRASWIAEVQKRAQSTGTPLGHKT